jgi:hypothetical protein
MKNWKTTIIGALLAVMTAVQPLLDGSGYHFDRPTIARLTFAGLIAALGYLAKDKDKEKPQP